MIKNIFKKNTIICITTLFLLTIINNPFLDKKSDHDVAVAAETGGDSFSTIDAPEIKTQGSITSWSQLGTNIINLLVKISGSLLIIVILVSGVMYVTSAGNEEQAQKAQKALTGAVIGVVILSLAWAIITLVAGFF